MINNKIFTKKLLSLILLFCIVLCNNVAAQTESYIQTITGIIQPKAVCRVADEKFANKELWGTVKNNGKVQNLITFELRYDTSINFYSKPFGCELVIDIDYKDSSNEEQKLTDIKLSLKYDTAKGKAYKGIAYYKFAGGHDVTVTVKSISSKEFDVTKAAFFRIKNQILIDRTYKKREGNKTAAFFNKKVEAAAVKTIPGTVTTNLAYTDPSGTNRQMLFTWDPADFEYDKFDFEYTFYDAKSLLAIQNFSTGIFDNVLLASAFKNNATRVSLDEPSYLLNLVFPKGYLLIRIRAYTYNVVDGEMDRDEGDWHYIADDGINHYAVYAVDEHEANLNWQYSAAFAEQGKRKEVVSYFDGGNKSRQSVTISNSDNVSIVAESVLDKQNRPAVSILPVPTDENTIHFFRAFNRNASDNVYSYADFNPDNNCVSNAQPMSTNFGSSRYYSPNNPWVNDPITKDVPDAAGYPFAVTEFTNDQTGRIRRQGGVGPTFQLGGGKETSYYYGKPAQEELDRLFGSEAGNAAHYAKNMVVDANGQVSVSYVDIAGKTVATALAGNVPGNLKALESQDGSAKIITDELIHPQGIVRDAANLKLSFNTTVMVPTAADYNFKYEFSGRSLELVFGWNPAKQVCADCYYDVKFSISNECGEPVTLTYNGGSYTELLVPATFNYGNNVPNPNTACGTVLPTQIGNIIAAFPKTGEYKVSYELVMSRKALDFYMEYIKQANVTKTIDEYKKDYLKKIDLTGCFSDCKDCIQKLGSQAEFIERIRKILLEVDNIIVTTDDLEWIKLLYNETLHKCSDAVAKNCTITDGCAEYRKMMLKDVSPGGQYMLYDENTLLFKERGNSENVGTNAFLKAKADPASPNVQINRAGVDMVVPIGTLQESELISNWQPEWAYLMLKYHPEKCLLDECEQQSASKNRDKDMLQTDDDIEAGTKYGWSANNYGTFLSNEFLLISAPYTTACISNDINSKVNVFIPNIPVRENVGGTIVTHSRNVSLMEFIKYTIYCPDAAKAPEDPNTHRLPYINMAGIPTSITCPTPLAEWRLFRNLYIAIKQVAYRNPACKATGQDCGNCYIGVNVFSSMYSPKADPLYYPQLKDFIIQVDAAGTGLEVKYDKETPINNRCDVYIHKAVLTGGIVTSVQVLKAQYQENGIGTFAIPGANVDDKDLYFVEHIINNYNHNIDGTTPASNCPNRNDFLLTLPTNKILNITYTGKYPILNPAAVRVHWTTYHCWPNNGEDRYNNIVYQPLESGLKNVNNNSANTCRTENQDIVWANYCAGTPSSCISDSRWPSYFQKARRFFESSSTDDINTVLQNANGGEPLGGNSSGNGNDYQQNAEDLSAGWMEKLKGCANPADPNDAARREELRQRLIAVCVAGSDQMHPYGSSTTKGSVQTLPYGDRSFKEAIVWYLGGPETATCNAYAIDFPLPYGDKTPLNDDIVNKLSECGYRLLTRFKTEWLAVAGPSGNTLYPNLATYIKKNYDPNFYLTDAQINDLVTSYLSGCPLKRPIRIPGILTRCDNPATPTCLKCGQLYAIQVKFQAAYPQFPPSLPNYYELLAGYINEQYQMNVSPTAVYTAVEKCKMTTTFNDSCAINQCAKVITALQNFYQVMPLSEYTNKITCDPTNCSTILATFRQHITTWLNLNLGWNKSYTFYSTNYFSGCASIYYQEPSCGRFDSKPGPGGCLCVPYTLDCCTNYQPFTTFRSLYPNPVDPRILAFFFELRRYTVCPPTNLPNISYQSSYNTLVNYFTNLVPGLIPYCTDTILTKERMNRIASGKADKTNDTDNPGPITNVCAVVISGNVWHDVNGMTDGYVNNSGAAATPPAANIPTGLYAYLVSSTSLTIQKLTTVNSGTGVFSFGQTVCNTNYRIYISNVVANVGDPAPATTLPLNWVHTGQEAGTGPGDDGTNDGILALPYGFSANADFGIKFNTDPGPDPEDTTTTVSGNVWGDVNGMTDGYVNNTSSWGTMGQNTVIPAGLRAYLLVPATVGNFIADVSVVDPLTGAYSFTNVGAGSYIVRISALVANIGDPYPAAVLPYSWIHTGQHLGSGAGDDGSNDGSINITAGASAVTGVNFGIRNNAPANTSCPLWTFTFAPVVATGCGSIYDTTFATNDLVLCSSPLTPVYQSDSNECIKNTVNAALANAEYAYNEYLKDFMRDYREAYFAKCMSITPSLLMSGQQQEYHYTLYYYDQSGNLVKTIPPKGVNYLNTTQVQETGRLRDEDNGDCYKNSTAPIFSNTATHQVTVPANKYPSHKDGPVTIESWVKFDNTSTSQMIVNQFDDGGSAGKAGYYAYINGGKLYFSIYGRSAETWIQKQVQWLYFSMLPNVRAHSYTTINNNLQRVRQFRAACNTENLVTSNTGANNGFYHIVYQYNGNPADPAPVKIYVNGILQTLNWTATGNGVSNTFVDGLANVPSVQVPSIDEIKYEQISVQSAFTTASATPLTMGAISRTVDGLTMQGVQGRIKHFRLYNAAPDAADLRRNSFDGCFIPSVKEGLVLWLPLNKATGGYTEELQSGSEVSIVADWDAPAQPQYPLHKLPTYYAYNSLNQVIHQETPDAGQSDFWYDRLGRLVVSQNAEQKTATNSDPSNRYSYTLYDGQGRIAEVGEKVQTAAITTIDTKDQTALNGWLNQGTDRQVTQTIYDNPDPAITTNTQILADQQHHFNSRKRVVTSLYRELKALPSQYNYATHYVYDISGNVKRLYQENKELVNGKVPNTTKVLDYDFDLISGKVNNVWYQKDQQDQYLYRYYYDADNKVIKAESGRDELTLRTDSKYQYYKHGPLGRTELGHDVVQGVDYAYTLQGWLKGINGLRLNKPATSGGDNAENGYDLGNDGEAVGGRKIMANDHSAIPVDVYAYTLGYYSNDYTPINNRGDHHPISISQFGFNDQANADGTGYQLFNGNIAYTTYANRKLVDPTSGIGTEDLLPHTYSYQYDQLNRLVQMRNHRTFDPGHFDGWDYSTIIDDYAESISYDANGNIKTYNRKGPQSINLEMDDLAYVYKDEDNNNKLDHVTDGVSAGNYSTEDIDNQDADNYDYDKIGNLIKDDAEKIKDIQWTVYGKIRSIRKQDGTLIEYSYDPSGNRIAKTVSSGRSSITTYYYRDASGNVMAVYEQYASEQWTWTEQDLYGSSRLGMWHPNISMTGDIPHEYDETELGSRSYELTNHLGNVMATVSDKIVLIPDHLCGACPWLGACPCGYYGAEVLTAQDYYPFGMLMPGRKYDTGSGYRYGFNGKEDDGEVKGEGNQLDYGKRIYDSRLGKFLSVDPLTKSYPMLTPYQFASNRPIDGIDMDGMEYMTFNVKVLKDADGCPVFEVTIKEDFRGMSGEQVAAVHGRGKAYAQKFYSKYSESFGPKGRGFLFNYFDEEGNQIGQPVWQMKQSKLLNVKNSGYYSGSGSITFAGPGPKDKTADYLNNQYDFSYTPMNYSDKISKDHDEMQDNEIVQPQGWLEDTRTLKSDRILLKAAKDGIDNNLTNSKEDLARAKNIKLFFSFAIMYKEWKVKKMEQNNLNRNSINDQRQIILKDWHPTIFKPKAWIAKILLSISGGGATSRDVKPPEPKQP